MWSVLSLLLACSEPEPAAPVASGPAEQVALVRQGIQAAHRSWSAGEYDEAKAQVMQTYSEAFTPLEPALRAADPTRALRLEYRMGLLSQHLGRKGNPVQIATEVRELVAEIEAAVGAATPVDPTAPAAAPTPTAPVTTAIEVKAPVANPADAAVGTVSDKDEGKKKSGR